MPQYFSLILYPHDLHIERIVPVYGNLFDGAVLGGLALLGFCAAFVVFSRRKGNDVYAPLGWGIVWFFAAYFPCSGILVPMNALFLEHWMLLPLAGLMLGAGETLHRLVGNEKARKAVLVLCVVYLGFFVITLWRQNATWRDPITFYSYILSALLQFSWVKFEGIITEKVNWR